MVCKDRRNERAVKAWQFLVITTKSVSFLILCGFVYIYEFALYCCIWCFFPLQYLLDYSSFHPVRTVAYFAMHWLPWNKVLDFTPAKHHAFQRKKLLIYPQKEVIGLHSQVAKIRWKWWRASRNLVEKSCVNATVWTFYWCALSAFMDCLQNIACKC